MNIGACCQRIDTRMKIIIDSIDIIVDNTNAMISGWLTFELTESLTFEQKLSTQLSFVVDCTSRKVMHCNIHQNFTHATRIKFTILPFHSFL